jgi:hypothetical protein
MSTDDAGQRKLDHVLEGAECCSIVSLRKSQRLASGGCAADSAGQGCGRLGYIIAETGGSALVLTRHNGWASFIFSQCSSAACNDPQGRRRKTPEVDESVTTNQEHHRHITNRIR